MCGDHEFKAWLVRLEEGSPPHVRGPQKRNAEKNKKRGITPACAGTTLAANRNLGIGWDHPRMCGDHQQRRK